MRVKLPSGTPRFGSFNQDDPRGYGWDEKPATETSFRGIRGVDSPGGLSSRRTRV